MRPRSAVVAVSLALLAAAPGASAARPRVCPMVTDARQDTVVSWNPTVERDMPALDLHSLDMVSDQRSLTAVVRVRQLAATSADAPFGARWSVTFRASGTTAFLYLQAVSDANGGVAYFARYVHPTAGVVVDAAPVTGVFDVKRDEVRITAPLDVFESVSPLTPGTWLEGIGAAAAINYPLRQVGSRVADQTRSGAHQVAGRSCLRR